MQMISKVYDYSLRRDIVLIAGFTLAMIAASFIRIPLFFTPVPLTMQTFILFSSIAVLRRRAFIPQMIYLFLGAIGLPVFASAGAGVAYLFGSSAGYLWGFLAVSILLGGVDLSSAGIAKRFFIFLAANVFIIYGLGAGWLALFSHSRLDTVIVIGVVPFLAGDILKIAAASLISPRY